MQNASLPELLGRLVLALGVVMTLMILVARFARNRGIGGLSLGGRGPARAPRIEVVARQQLGKASSVAVVRAGGRALLVGVTDTSVTLLAELEDDPVIVTEDAGPEANWTASQGDRPGPPWKSLIAQARERTVRR